MARLTDPTKITAWRSRFQRFRRSDMTVARFCAAERVTEPSFYYWQKKLGMQSRRRRAPAKRRSDGACNISTHTSTSAGTDAESRATFQPITVVPGSHGVVVQLPGGARIEMDAQYLDAIRAVVAEIVRAEPGRGDPAFADHRHRSADNQVTGVTCGAVPC